MADKTTTLNKPLNILIYIDNDLNSLSGQISTTNATQENLKNEQLFSAIQQFLAYYLSQKFTIYSTTLAELNRRAWFKTTKLLIVVKSNQNDDITFLQQSRNSIIREFQTKTNNTIILDYSLLVPATNQSSNDQLQINLELIKTKVRQKLGDQFVYDNYKVPELTTHYVYSADINLSAKLRTYLEKVHGLDAKLYGNLKDIDVNFDVKKYLEYLSSTNQLARNVIVSNVTRSTQPIAEQSPVIDGLIVIANQQTEAKGRGQNQWISPEGSISFTYSVSVPLNSILFKCLAFFQHINALAILLAIKKFKSMEKLDLKIKWPNDIYYKSKHKIVGILTNSQFEGNCAKFFIGTGINYSNAEPTYSLKNIIQEELKETEFDISREELIAEIINQVSRLIKMLNSQGKQKIVDLYYENWMLTDKIIQLDTGKKAQILGLDEDGFLRVNLIDEGEIVSLLPDGNRFDILENLVINQSSFDLAE